MAGASQTIELKDLVDFEHYAAYAMCDQDCDAIGLKLNAAMFSSNMETVEEETERTAVAGFEFSARPLSDHELEVTMTECSSEPCFFGVVVYELKKKSKPALAETSKPRCHAAAFLCHLVRRIASAPT